MSVLLLATRFLAELAGVVAVSLWGSNIGGASSQLLLAIGAPASLIVAWAIVVAPRARNPLTARVRELVGSGLLLLAAGALAGAGWPLAAAAYAFVVLADQALLLMVDRGAAMATLATRHA